MSESYIRYYQRFHPMAPWVFGWKALFTQNKRRQLSLQARQQDYMELLRKNDLDLLALHLRLNELLEEGYREWQSYDYGEGYYYQSCAEVGVTGFRDTAGRIQAMKLPERLSGMNVLEIGCNAGFLSVGIAPSVKNVVGFDIAPHLIKIGQETARYLKRDNIRLECTTFEDFKDAQTYDAVLSFANHSTYDGNSTLELDTFFNRCRDFLKPGGLLLFESHPPALENPEQVDSVIGLISRDFDIESREILDYGRFLDRDRTFVIARKK